MATSWRSGGCGPSDATMPWPGILICTILVLSTSATINIRTVQEWAQQLGEKLWELGDHTTGLKELKYKFNKQVSYRFVSKDDRTLVQEIAYSFQNMTSLKVSAVKVAVGRAHFTDDRWKKGTQHLLGKLKSPSARLKISCEDNIIWDLKEVDFEGDWKALAQGKMTYLDTSEPLAFIMPRMVKNAEALALRLYNKTGVYDINTTYFGTKSTDPAGDPLDWVYRLNVSPNRHFRGEPVNISYGSVHIPTNIHNRDEHIVNVIEWTEELERTFKSNYEQDPSLSWQYFCSYTGVMRQYPGVSWNHSVENVDMFDCRMRLWYIEASTSPKDMVILLDNSGSMLIRHRQEVARHLVNNILESLGSNDFVTVLKFSAETDAIIDCFNDTLVQANIGNVRDLKLAMKSLLPENLADFEIALTAAFEMLQKAHNESMGACCNRAIVLITDGIPDYYKEVFDKYNGEAAMGVRIFMYLIGEEDPVTREMEWIACKNNGISEPLKTTSEVREKVLSYMQVMSRPLVLVGEQPINWTPIYADVADPRLSDWLWMQRENEEQHEVSNFCFFPKKWPSVTFNSTGKVFKNCTEEPGIKRAQSPTWSRQVYHFMTSVSMAVLDFGENRTKTAQIVGVAGTDIPIEDIKKLLLPYRIGVNGYAFIITNNGHILVHPDLRAEFLGILKPHYNSVDLTEVELVDDNSFETRIMNYELLEIRKSMIEQEYGKKTLKMKYHSDKMRRVSTVQRNFHYIGIKDTPFSLGVAVPTSYGLYSIHVSSELVKFYTARVPLKGTEKKFKDLLQQIQEFIKDTSWTIHPEWMYCKYHYDTAHDFRNPEDELRHFLETRGVQCTSARHLTPPELLKPPFERVGKDSCYCDQDLLTSLISDIIETRFWSKRNVTKLKEFGIKEVFLATHSGLTRWINLLDDSKKNYLKQNNTRAVDEIWYQRAVELQTKEGVFVYSVPFAGDPGGDEVTATSAIFIDSKKVPVAVAGYRLQFLNLHMLFIRYTCKECGSTPGCTTCLTDALSCYVLDNNGYIVMSEISTDRGKFFGEVQGEVLNMMVEEGIFRKVRIFDYQAICLIEDKFKNPASIRTTPLQHVLQLFDWVIGTAIWLFAQTMLWFQNSSQAKLKPTMMPRDDIKINRTHLEPCVDRVDLYHLQKYVYPDPSNFSENNCRNPKPNQNSKPFVVQKVAHSNLVLVVVDNLCVSDFWTQVKIVRRVVDDGVLVSCMNALNANLTRKRPKVCVGKAGKGEMLKEPPSPACSGDVQFQVQVSKMLTVLSWIMGILSPMQH